MKKPFDPDDPTGDLFPEGDPQKPKDVVPLRWEEMPSPVKIENAHKLERFKQLFHGRFDAYAKFWENPHTDKHGYIPACENDRHPLLCRRPEIPCRACNNRLNLPLTDETLSKHLHGRIILGMYPLMVGDECHLVAVDFDKQAWKTDVTEFLKSCKEISISAYVEISRSGNGAHVWIFFEAKVPAYLARALATSIISHACTRTGQINFDSYDRLFPNQNTMPAGGFGNLIALPLQREARNRNCTVFVDENFDPYPDQWAFLETVQGVSVNEIAPAIFAAVGAEDPLDVAYAQDSDWSRKAKKNPRAQTVFLCPLPTSIQIRLEDQIYIQRSLLPSQLINKLLRLSAFQNPKFYKAQANGHSTYNIPRVACSGDATGEFLKLPRGCLSDVLELLKASHITTEVIDNRFQGSPINVTFKGQLYDFQEPAMETMLEHDNGILWAGTAFGKTVISAAMIAKRGVNTVVIVYTALMLDQWKQALQLHLGVGDDVVGTLGDGQDLTTGLIDVILIQSLSDKGKFRGIINRYGQVVIDECHHASAATYERTLNHAKARYVLGLSANKKRRDGHHPKVFMQCGPIRFAGEKPKKQNVETLVKLNWLEDPIDLPPKADYNDIIRHITHDEMRTLKLIRLIKDAHEQGRRVLVLTARVDHLSRMEDGLRSSVPNLLVIRGGITKKTDKADAKAEMEAFRKLPFEAPRVILTTGKMAGEAFDHAPLNTLVLATPISWEDDVRQYTGRVDRNLVGNTDTWILDLIDTGHPFFVGMWKKRKLAYKHLKYRVQDPRGTLDIFSQ